MTKPSSFRRALILGLAVLTLATLSARAQAKIDISGTWVFTIQADAASGTPTVTLKQEGERVTGHISSPSMGEQDFTGTLKGQALAITFGSDLGEGEFKGTADSSDAIKGSIEIPGGGIAGTFTAKRKT